MQGLKVAAQEVANDDTATELTTMAGPKSTQIDDDTTTELTMKAVPNSTQVDVDTTTELTKMAGPNSTQIDVDTTTELTMKAGQNAGNICKDIDTATELTMPGNVKIGLSKDISGVANFEESKDSMPELTTMNANAEQNAEPQENVPDAQSVHTIGMGANPVDQVALNDLIYATKTRDSDIEQGRRNTLK